MAADQASGRADYLARPVVHVDIRGSGTRAVVDAK